MFDINDHVLGFKSKPLVMKCKYCELVFTSTNKDRWISHLRAFRRTYIDVLRK